MLPSCHHKLSCVVTLIAVLTSFAVEHANADSSIRIIGDKSVTTTEIPGTPAKTVSSPAGNESATIKIIGDTSGAELMQHGMKTPDSKKEIRIIGDKREIVPEKSPDQREEKIAEKNQLTPENSGGVGLSDPISEKLLAERLAALKEEEQRKAAEQAEQERLAKEKIEQENEAARQTALRLEQAQRAARLAEESRKAELKAEQERAEIEAKRQAAIRQEQGRLAAHKAEDSRRAAEKAEQEKLAAEALRQAAIKQEQERLAARKAEETRRAAEKAEQARLAPEATGSAAHTLAKPSRPDREPKAGEGYTGIDLDSNPGALVDDSSGSSPETIWDLYTYAKAVDPVLGRTLARVTGSKADSDVLLSTLLPHVDSTAGLKQISQTLANYTPNDVSNDYTSLYYNVTARMTLLHVPTIYSLSAATAALKAEEAGVAVARQNLIVKFIDAYIAVLKAQTDTKIAQGEINRLKQVLNQSQAFLKSGTGDIIAVYEARSRLDGAAADLSKSESTLRLAEQKLSSIIGKPVVAIMNYLPQQPTGPDPDDLEWWVSTMEKEQPIIRQAREGLVQTAEQKKAVRSEYLPIVQASGGYDVNRGTAALPTAEVRQWFVGASLSLPLYSGGETSAKIRRATATEEERRHGFDETMDLQRENVKQAFFNLRYNISYIKALEQKKASAEIQLSAVSKGRKIGTRSAIDVLNAEQTYSVALRDYNYALYDNILRVIQLKSSAGILEEADVSEISKIPAPFLMSRLIKQSI
jgi:outer membrane protein